MSEDGASILDLESIWILLIASFLIEINAKYPKKAGDGNCQSPNLGYIIDVCDKNCQSPNLGCIIDDCSSYVNSHDVMSALNSIYIFVCIWGHNMT